MRKEAVEILKNKSHPKVRLNTICPYFTMFPLAFPYKVLQQAKKNDTVYDPFCGRGTTNFAARLLGLNSYGIDSNPIAHAVSQSKLINVRASNIYERCQEILHDANPTSMPVGEFWDWAYHPETFNNICILRTYFLDNSTLDNTDIALRAILLGILHGPVMKTQPSYLSNQMPRTYSTKPNYSVNFWKKRDLRPQNVNIPALVERKANYIFNEHIPRQVDGKIVYGDSRLVEDIFEEKFNWVITSPPYFGMSTYPQDQWLRNWFLGGNSEIVYSASSQLKHGSENVFINDLAKVWQNTALKCNPGARMILRFGALPSKLDKSPSALIRESFNMADCGWKVTAVRSAGEPNDSQRQANQFQGQAGKYVREIDVYATLTI